MRANDNLQEIKATLEKTCREEAPDISTEIINSIVNIEFENQEKDRRLHGQTEVHKAIKQYIDSIVKED